MHDTWTVPDAAARLDEVIRRATRDGPQILTAEGQETAVVLSPAAWHRLMAETAGETASFKAFLTAAPKFDDDVADALCERPRDMGRDVDV